MGRREDPEAATSTLDVANVRKGEAQTSPTLGSFQRGGARKRLTAAYAKPSNAK